MNTTLPTKLLAFVLSLMLTAVAAAQTSAFASYYNNRGLAREAKGDLDGAIADFNRAIELDPKLAISYHNRGLAQKAKGDQDGAIPNYNNRGITKEGKGDHDGAIADYSRAIELDPKLAIFCVDGTIADYNRAIELDPKQPKAYINRGFAKQAKGDVDSAIADYNRALELAAKLAKP